MRKQTRFGVSDVLPEIKYIADSPLPEHGGFHPQIVLTAKRAMREILKLRRMKTPNLINMNIKEKMLAASLLELASNEFQNHGCNDWDFPNSWTKDEKIAFLREYHDWNGDPEEFSERYLHIQDYAVMDFMAHKLSQL